VVLKAERVWSGRWRFVFGRMEQLGEMSDALDR
jgi:hypothetical protein